MRAYLMTLVPASASLSQSASIFPKSHVFRPLVVFSPQFILRTSATQVGASAQSPNVISPARASEDARLLAVVARVAVAVPTPSSELNLGTLH